MRPLQASCVLSLAILCAGLAGCGGLSSAPTLPAAPPATPPATLTGNWLLAGSRVPAVYPVVSTSLFIQGSSVTGRTAFAAQCRSAAGLPGTFGASGFPLTGSIANNGTFQAATGNFGDPSFGMFSLSLTGNSPLPAAPSVWTGTYSVTYTPGTNALPCGIAQTGTFAATPIASLTGTYTGVLANPGVTASPFGATAVVTLQVTQGAPTLVSFATSSSYQYPLTASLTVTNSPCALSVSTSGATSNSSIGGDQFNLFFAVPGSTGGNLNGTLNDATAMGFAGDLISVAKASGCAGSFAFYNFTRK